MSDSHVNARPGYWEWIACGASVTGSQHLKNGLGCDDAFGYGVSDDFVVAVVADGAGSVSGTSAWGSFAACQSVLKRGMGEQFMSAFRRATADDADDIMRWIFECALNSVTRQAEAMGLPVAALSTTLCVAMATPELAIFGQIGDGVIASMSDNTVATHLIEDKGDYVNATCFIQSEGAFERAFRTSAHTEMTALALSTDGLSYKITNVTTGEPYEPFFTGSWRNLHSGARAADLAALLRGIEDDQTGDDKTLVLAALRWADDEFYPSARPLNKSVTSSPMPAASPARVPAAAVDDDPRKPAQPNVRTDVALDTSNGPRHNSFRGRRRGARETEEQLDTDRIVAEPSETSPPRRRRWTGHRHDR